MNRLRPTDGVDPEVLLRRKKAKIYCDKNRQQRRELNKTWIYNNRERYYSSKCRYRLKLKKEILGLYSDKLECTLCGYNKIDALVLDHIHENGAKQRKEMRVSSRGNNSGCTMYEYIRSHGKIDGLQVLCANCNLIKHLQYKRRQTVKDLTILAEIESMYGH